jgi:hypothetical protein
MKLKFKVPDYNKLEKDKANGNGQDGSITVRNEYPPLPVPCFELTEGFSWNKVQKV